MPYKKTFVPGEIIRSSEFNVNFDVIDDYIDETTDARGSKSSLDGRLDVSLNEDGTLKVVSIDHGSLSGLLDDDHTQYLLADGTRILSGSLAVAVGITIDGVDISVLKTDVDGFPDGLKNLTAIEIQQLANINLETISNTQWGYLGELDQSIKQSATPTFAGLDVTGNLTVDSYTFPNYDGALNQVMITDGSGNITWEDPSGGVTDHGLLSGLADDDHIQYLLRNILTTKGDIYVATGAGVVTRLGVGADTEVLTADSVQASGIKWAGADGGGAGKAFIELLPGSAKLPNDAFGRLGKVTRAGSNPDCVDNVIKYNANGDDSDEYAYWQKRIPIFYQGGNLTITIVSCSNDTNAGAPTADLHFDAMMINDDEAWDTTFTAIGTNAIGMGSAAYDLMIDTIAWTSNLPTAGDMIKFRVWVDESDSDLAVDLQIIDITIEED